NTRLQPARRSSASGSTVTASPRKRSVRPAERGDASSRSSSHAKARCSSTASSSSPTAPLAPTVPPTCPMARLRSPRTAQHGISRPSLQPENPHTIGRMWVGGHELALIVVVLVLVTLGPPLAGAALAWVRRRRRQRDER